jgi:hypothetical protein
MIFSISLISAAGADSLGAAAPEDASLCAGAGADGAGLLPQPANIAVTMANARTKDIKRFILVLLKNFYVTVDQKAEC